MGFLRLNKNQIGLGSVGNTHIDSSDKILESNLTLDFSTAGLSTAISDLSAGVGALASKKVAVFGQVVNQALTSGISVIADVDALVAGVYPDTLVAGGNSGASGAITSAPFNKVPIKISGTSLPLEMTEGGPDIFGRLEYNAGAAEGSKYSVALFYIVNDVETVATLASAVTVDMLIPMSVDLADVPFQSLTHGVAFVDGLPVEHFHDIASVNGLQLELDTLYDESAALSGRLDTAEGDIDAIELAATALAGRVTATEGEIDTLQTDVGALQESSVSIGDVALMASIKEGIDLTAQVNGVLVTYAVGENYVANSLRVFVNGSRQTRGVQYTENGATGEFTFIGGIVPASPDNVTVDYIKLV